MVFSLFRALKSLCHNPTNFKVVSPPISVFSFNKTAQKLSCKKQFYTQRWSSLVAENMQDLQELFFRCSRWTVLEPKFSPYMMESTRVSPWCANVLHHCHLGGGIFLAEKHSTLKWQVERQMLKLFTGVPISASVDGFHCLCELQLNN